MILLLVDRDRRRRRSVAHWLRRQGVRVTDVDDAPPTFVAEVGAALMILINVKNVDGRDAIVIDDSVQTKTPHEIAAHIVDALRSRGVTLAPRQEFRSNVPVLGGAIVRVLIVDDYEPFRSGLLRSLRYEAERHGVEVELAAVGDATSALEAFERQAPDVAIIDERLGVESEGGCVALERMRERGFVGRAFVLTAAKEYAVEAKAEVLGARFVPKESLDATDFAMRVLGVRGMADHTSSVRLRRVSSDEVAAYLASSPEGLHDAMARARARTVKVVVAECNGNRSAAARRLRMTRQQVQTILENDEDDDST